MKFRLILSSAAIFIAACTQREAGSAVPAPPAARVSAPASSAVAAPVPTDRVNFADKGIEKYIRGFWPDPHPDSRWTNSRHVEILLSYNDPAPSRIKIMTGAFLVPGKLDKQLVRVSVNGKPIGTIEVNVQGMHAYTVDVPEKAWIGANSITLDLPNADSPAHFGMSGDGRTLALNMQSLAIEKRS